MKNPRYGQQSFEPSAILAKAHSTLRDYACSDVGTGANTSKGMANSSATYPYGAMNISFQAWKFISELPTAVRDGALTLKGFHRMRDGPICLKTSVSHSLMTTYRMNLL
jgi:hypothetical protein